MVAISDAGANFVEPGITPIFKRLFTFFPPIGGEAAGAGGGEDGLAKAFEQDGNLRQSPLAGVHFAQQRLQLRHNPPLLGERSER